MTNICFVDKMLIETYAQFNMAEIERKKIAELQKVAQDLQGLVHSWIGTGQSIREVDWSKIKTLEFQEGLKTRESIATRLTKEHSCARCPNFEAHVSNVGPTHNVCQSIDFLPHHRSTRSCIRNRS